MPAVAPSPPAEREEVRWKRRHRRRWQPIGDGELPCFDEEYPGLGVVKVDALRARTTAAAPQRGGGREEQEGREREGGGGEGDWRWRAREAIGRGEAREGLGQGFHRGSAFYTDAVKTNGRPRSHLDSIGRPGIAKL